MIELLIVLFLLSAVTLGVVIPLRFSGLPSRQQGTELVTKKGDRDQFPGRRQGGGSRGFVEPAEDDDFTA
jgi:hypothetical protein